MCMNDSGMDGSDRTREITLEVGEKEWERINRRLRLTKEATDLSAEEVARRYLEYGMLYHEKAIRR